MTSQRIFVESDSKRIFGLRILCMVSTKNTADISLWATRPSILLLLPLFLLCAVCLCIILGSANYIPGSKALEVIPLWLILVLYFFYKYLQNRTTSYRLTKKHFFIKTGIFRAVHEYVSEYEVEDVEIHRVLWQRLFGLAQLRLIRRGSMTPLLLVDGVRDVEGVRETIRYHWVNMHRRVKRNIWIQVDPPYKIND